MKPNRALEVLNAAVPARELPEYLQAAKIKAHEDDPQRWTNMIYRPELPVRSPITDEAMDAIDRLEMKRIARE